MSKNAERNKKNKRNTVTDSCWLRRMVGRT